MAQDLQLVSEVGGSLVGPGGLPQLWVSSHQNGSELFHTQLVSEPGPLVYKTPMTFGVQGVVSENSLGKMF